MSEDVAEKKEKEKEGQAQGSGKQGKAGVYLIANGAECMCDQGIGQVKGKFKVSSHKILHINDKDGDKKLLATTADLPLPFEATESTFGKCKKQPSGASHNPCIPNIQKWENSYEAIRVEQAGGTALTEESEGICTFGGTVTFFSTGQKEEITAADMAATPPAIVELSTNFMLTKEQIEKMIAGEFEDEETVGVRTIDTQDGNSTYHKGEKTIVLKVKEYSGGTPEENKKMGINWAVYHKEKQSDPVYKKQYTFVDKGDSFEFPYRTTGLYAVEAYGHSESMDPKTGEGGAYKQITIAHQGPDTKKELQLQGDGEDRNGQKRIRPTETATIAVPMLFPKVAALKPKDLYWEVTSKGEKLPFTKKGTGIVVPPLNNKKTKKVTAKVTFEDTVKTITYDVGHNHVKAIRSDKETIGVLQHGEQQKERHQVTFEVSEYAMPYNAAKDAHLKVKWIAYHSKPDTDNQIGTGQKITKTSDKEGEWHVEAYVSTPQGAGKDTTTRIKAITPKLTKAYWANAEGHAIQKSGFGHKVYIHLGTEGLQGEKLQPNIWYGRQGSDRYQKQQAPCIEITETNGMVNLAYKLPKYDKADNLDYFFTIENLEFPVEGTDQYPKAGNELIISNNCTPKLLNVRRKKQINSLKMYEEGNKLHTGIVTYGDTVTIKVCTRNYIGETLDFEVWEDKKQDNHTDEYSTWDTWDDEKLPETIQVKIDSEGKGETSFTVPCDWENKHSKEKEGQPRYFYLKEKESGEEFPRAYYVKNPNKTEEENKKNSQRIGALMLKVAKSLKRDKAKERESAVVLGEELPPIEQQRKAKGLCPDCGKKHVDIADGDKWVSQFDKNVKKWSDLPPKKACYDTCKEILKLYGLKEGSGTRGNNNINVIQTVKEVNGKIVVKNAKLGTMYLDNQLKKGNPILIGVRYAYKPKEYNYDKTTDHFIVIVGSGCEAGKVFYRYFEVGTYTKNKEVNGINPNNKMYLQKDGTIVGKSPQGTKEYTISQVRKNK